MIGRVVSIIRGVVSSSVTIVRNSFRAGGAMMRSNKNVWVSRIVSVQMVTNNNLLEPSQLTTNVYAVTVVNWQLMSMMDSITVLNVTRITVYPVLKIGKVGT